MRYSKLLLFISITLSSLKVLGQSDAMNLQKYWYYRDRFLNGFTIIGDGPGESLAAHARFKNFDNNQQSEIGFGADNTIDLAWYWAVLATEYKLLKDHDLDYTKTKKELYYALQAFNRLDVKAESYYRDSAYPSSYPATDLNGFFMRNDIESRAGYSYWENHATELSNSTFDLPEIHDLQNATSDLDQFGIIPTDYRFRATNCQGSGEMSKDQVFNLIMGLALIKKCVDPDDYYADDIGARIFMDGEISFVQETKNIANRLMAICSGYSWGNEEICLDWSGENGNKWCINNPVLNIAVSGNTCCCGVGSVGGTGAAKYGIAKAIMYITDQVIGDYLTTAEQSEGYIAWQLGDALQNDNAPVGDGEYYKVIMLAAIGHSLHSSYIPYENNTQQQLCTATHSIDHGTLWGGWIDCPIIPLLHAYLHDKELDCFDQSEYSDLLSSAPCEGPYNFSSIDGFPSYSTYEWSSDNRFVWPERRGDWTIDQPAKSGEYNGLDYMLLHNLYYLYYGFPAQWEIGSYNPLVFSDQIEYTNVNYYIEKYDYPRQDYVDLGPGNASYTVDIGTNEHPKVVSAFHTISSGKVIGIGGNVTYKFGDLDGFIEIPPGFDAVNADFFEMIQDPLTCNTTSNVYEKHASSSTSNFHSSTYNPVTPFIIPPTIDSVIHFQNIKLYPNPASNSVTITTGDNQTYKLVMADMYGKAVKEISFNGPAYQMNLSAITVGVYMVQVSDQSGQIIGQSKLIVQ